jgi:hypothetical protein
MTPIAPSTLRSAIVAAILILLAAAAPAWAGESYSISPEGVGQFNVIDGQPVILSPGESGPGGNALDVVKKPVTTITHYGSGKRLCYSLDGKDKKVALGSGEGAGSDWLATKTGGRGDAETVTVQVAEGKCKGWYLDCAEEEEKLQSGDTTYTVRRLILAEKPQRIKTFSRYVVAP